MESAIVHRPGHTILSPPFALHLCPPYVCPTCTHHLNTRARACISPSRSRPPSLLCVNCIIFTPNTFRPHAPPHGLQGQQVKLHMSIVSHPPWHGQSSYPSSTLSLPSTWVFPFYRKSRIFALSAQRPVVLYDLRIMQKVGVGDHDFVTAQFS